MSVSACVTVTVAFSVAYAVSFAIFDVFIMTINVAIDVLFRVANYVPVSVAVATVYVVSGGVVAIGPFSFSIPFDDAHFRFGYRSRCIAVTALALGGP